MKIYWVQAASISLIATIAVYPSHLHAQDRLTEQAAITAALAREGIAARDQAERSAADADVDIASRWSNPSVDLSRESGGDETEWHIGVSQAFDLNGKRRSLRNAARSEAEALEQDQTRRRQMLIAETRMAFARCAAGFEAKAIWLDYVANLKEAERIAGARAERGDAAFYDVRRVRVAHRTAKAESISVDGGRKAECVQLTSLTGVSNPQPMGLPNISSVRQLEPIRPDLDAQEQRILAASQRVRAAEKARLPELIIGAGVRRVSDPTGSAIGPTISVGMSLPIFNNGKPAVRREQARKSALEADFLIAQRRVEAEQQAAAVRAIAAQEAANVAARSGDDAARLGQIAETAYKAGETGVLELVDAYEAQRDAQLAVIALASEAAVAAIKYDLATGRNIP